MVIRGVVQDGLIRIDVRGILPEGSSILVTPIDAVPASVELEYDLEIAKTKIREIAALPSLGPDDGFSGADHDKLLYGNAE